ncbi:GAF domain-containing SpoIIE family protein phosphatase [Longispora sp. NPDC051575]|uniref:PP2C family protein-serine/threonine phosphatase n=1 Tax=Longispora sp. NPDC051575 TaxID=3154943 RepID=UPI003428EDC1
MRGWRNRGWRRYIDRDLGLCASAILNDGPYVVRDADLDPRTLNHPLVRGGLKLRFYAAVPLVTADGHRLGTVNVIDTAPRQITDSDLATLTDLAAIVMDELELRLAVRDQAAVEARARRHLEAERLRAQNIATTLGQSLIPSQLPTVANLHSEAHFQPFSSDNLGGDFYDLFPIDDEGRWGVFLGDVCGKGPRAAAVTSLIRYTLRAVSIIEPDPVKVLSHLHHTLGLDPDIDDHSYCTAVYATLQPHGPGWLLHAAAGGHPPPILIRADGTAEPIAVAGPAIGLLPTVEHGSFTTSTVHLAPADTVVFYTDGVTDLRHDDQWLGTEGLVEYLRGRRHTAGTAVTTLKEVVQAIGPTRDDIAILALSVPAS